MQIEARIAHTESRNVSFTMFRAQNIMAIVSVSLDLEVSIFAMFRTKNIGLTFPYVHVLNAAMWRKFCYLNICIVRFCQNSDLTSHCDSFLFLIICNFQNQVPNHCNLIFVAPKTISNDFTNMFVVHGRDTCYQI